MVNPKSLLNLKQNQVTGGPGRPEGSVSLTTAIKKYANEHPDEIEALVAKWYKNAKVSPAFAALVLERIDGKLPITGQVTGSIELLVRYDGNRNEVVHE